MARLQSSIHMRPRRDRAPRGSYFLAATVKFGESAKKKDSRNKAPSFERKIAEAQAKAEIK